MVRAKNQSCARIRSNDKMYRREYKEMAEHEYTDTFNYKKEKEEKQTAQKQEGVQKSIYILVSVLVAVIGSVCFLFAAILYLLSNVVEMIRNFFSKKKFQEKKLCKNKDRTNLKNF